MRPRRHRLDNDHVRVSLRVLIVAEVYLWSLHSNRVDDRVGIRGAVVLYVVAAGILWNLLLTDYSMGYTPANILLHIVVPVLAAVDWLVVGRRRRVVRWWQPLLWLIYPAAYLILALVVLNKAGRRAPYYFLDPDSVGMAVVTVNIGLLAAFILALGYGISAVGARRAEPTGVR
jgi:hypothetical protein